MLEPPQPMSSIQQPDKPRVATTPSHIHIDCPFIFSILLMSMHIEYKKGMANLQKIRTQCFQLSKNSGAHSAENL